MANSQKRSDVIKSVSLAGASIAVVNTVSAKSTLPDSNDNKIQNEKLTWQINADEFFK